MVCSFFCRRLRIYISTESEPMATVFQNNLPAGREAAPAEGCLFPKKYNIILIYFITILVFFNNQSCLSVIA